MTTKLSINLPPRAAAILEQLRQRDGATATMTVVRGLVLLHYLEEREREGASILVEDRTGVQRELTLPPNTEGAVLRTSGHQEADDLAAGPTEDEAEDEADDAAQDDAGAARSKMRDIEPPDLKMTREAVAEEMARMGWPMVEDDSGDVLLRVGGFLDATITATMLAVERMLSEHHNGGGTDQR